MSATASAAVLRLRDTRLSVAERYVLLVYAVHARQPDDTEAPLEAWPTATTVAKETGLTREHVQRCLLTLQQFGLLRQTGRRKGRANVYEVSLRRLIAMSEREVVVEPDITPSPTAQEPKCDVRSHPSVMSDHTEREVERKDKNTPLPPVQPTPFDDYWATVTRKEDKAAARKKWDGLIRRGVDPTIIITASQAYTDKVRAEGTETRYVKKPVNWLTAESWEDEMSTTAQQQAHVVGGWMDWSPAVTR